MHVFCSFQLGASPWPTSRHNSRIFPCILRHLAALLQHFSALFILPLFGIPTFSSFHCYCNILIGWLMLLSTAQPLEPIRRSFRRYSSTSDILFIFISPLLYLNFGITQKIERLLPPHLPLRIHCNCIPLIHHNIDLDLRLRSASFRLRLSFRFTLTLHSFNLAPLSLPLPQAAHRLHIAEGSVNHYLAQLS